MSTTRGGRFGTYRAKRDFARTPEPRDTRPPRRNGPLAFVVQKHAARRLHYDLRLEWDGVMKSWAVTRGPSLDPADNRLAVEVEDHPISYNRFEGTIPQGEYGGGTVQIWDRGTWEPDDPGHVSRDLGDGKLTFTLHGARLKGGFALVRMKGRAQDRGRRDWLLIKERDAAARPGEGGAVLAWETSVVSGRTLDEIAAGAAPPKPRGRSRVSPARNPDTSEMVIAGMAISHPDRVLWPKSARSDAVTKGNLARYLESFADRLLPHLARRPVSILRAPDGIDSQTFFQRHVMKGWPDSIREIDLPDDTVGPYLYIVDTGGLIALAQMNVVEFHPWGATVDALDKPDRLIFDLDPDIGLDFARVIEAAAEMKARLSALGLTPFLKSTGGKGLHVAVPLKRGATWAEAKGFARQLCTHMAQDAPDRFTVTLAKKARGGRIFLDYLRNDRTATAVAAWSPRGRPGAPVAVPLPWTALDGDLKAGGVPLRDLLAAPPKADPWAEFAAAALPLADAIGRLAGRPARITSAAGYRRPRKSPAR